VEACDRTAANSFSLSNHEKSARERVPRPHFLL
jgi:hypothetical protein